MCKCKDLCETEIGYDLTIDFNLFVDFTVGKFAVHQTKKLIGTFNPREEQYTFELEEGTTPTGFFARGPFLVRSKVSDSSRL